MGLTKHAAQAGAGPFEGAAVAGDAERHLGLDHFDGPLAQLEEPKEVGVGRGVADDLRGERRGFNRSGRRQGRADGARVAQNMRTLTKPLIGKQKIVA